MIELLQKVNGNLPRTEKEKVKMIKNAAKHYGNFLISLGFDWTKDANSDNTPYRVAKAWVEDLVSGTLTEKPKITQFPNEGYRGIVFSGNIQSISLCSHHNQTITSKCHVAYIPKKDGQVIGLSKIGRIVEWYSRRPQLQESLTTQIHDELNELIDNIGIAVMIEGSHGCCVNRGVKQNSVMKTTQLSGVFLENDDRSRDEFYNYIRDLKS
jgi:GTP cyclohydrolase I